MVLEPRRRPVHLTQAIAEQPVIIGRETAQIDSVIARVETEVGDIRPRGIAQGVQQRARLLIFDLVLPDGADRLGDVTDGGVYARGLTPRFGHIPVLQQRRIAFRLKRERPQIKRIRLLRIGGV